MKKRLLCAKCGKKRRIRLCFAMRRQYFWLIINITYLHGGKNVTYYVVPNNEPWNSDSFCKILSKLLLLSRWTPVEWVAQFRQHLLSRSVSESWAAARLWNFLKIGDFEVKKLKTALLAKKRGAYSWSYENEVFHLHSAYEAKWIDDSRFQTT